MASVLDSQLMQGNFSTPAIREIWSDENKIKAQLAVEGTLSKVEGELGVIPKEAGDKIASIADIKNFDLDAIVKESAEKMHSLIALIHTLQTLAGEESGEYVHFGATTQDIVDTGIMLQTKQAFDVLYKHSEALIAALTKQTEKYRNTPMIGRTHGIQAIPITFGFKLAVWLDEALRSQERLNELINHQVFVGSISGAVGTYAAFNGYGPEIEKRVLKALDLNVPNISWQSSRDRFSEIASVLGIYSGTLGKIGHELFNLMKTEVNEVTEPFKKGEIGSSTMPQKRNPALLEGLASLTQPVFSNVALIHQSMLFDGERDAIHWRSEWVALPQITNYLDAQLVNATHIINDFNVNEAQMKHNIELQGGLPFAEKIMFELGTVIGKQTAHELVYESAMTAIEQHVDFLELIYQRSEVSDHFSRDELKSWTNAENDLGNISERIDLVLAHAKSLKNG
ncbi:Lyase [Paucilactobacillus vaccinostercus DSM 20634]|uniref:Lyase n=1 Tax=Paucilactobacillus vaccinostercus DSM 20634 TaxID=1423813 RepID=A0A0R2AAT4_9LACO|nr:adenylosuccinate lyase family protein [Paucilactobacillus vaccinostercus]KRM61227.1 Lyase [Paucilactobacillus vaccinostercus DSM 20634]